MSNTNNDKNSKGFKDNPTEATSSDTDNILREILSNLEKVNFKILKHPRRNQILKRLDEIEDEENTTNKDSPNDQASGLRENIESMLEDIKVYERDYKVLAVEQIVKKAKELGFPMAFRKEAIYVYNGKHWDICLPDKYANFLEYCFLRLGVPLTTSKDAKFLKKGIEQIERAAHFEEQNIDKILLNFQNGTMEFNGDGDFEFRDHAPEDFITYVLPFEFKENSDSPKFQQYLDDVVPEKDKQKVLAEFIGSIFSPFKHEKVLILYGSGHNGKSVFLDVITGLLGAENVCSHTLESLTDSKLYFIGDLENCLLNYTGEISTKVNPDMFKKLASGEKVTARYPYGQPFEIENYARLAFNCNQLPEVKENTEGFFRRFKIVPFDVRISELKKDPDLAKKIIKNELPGIMNWVIEGLERLEENNELTTCKSGEQLLKEYRKESDTVGEFLRHSLHNFNEPIQASELYDKYNTFCYNFEYSKLGVKQFAQELLNKGIERSRKPEGRYYDVHKVDKDDI